MRRPSLTLITSGKPLCLIFLQAQPKSPDAPRRTHRHRSGRAAVAGARELSARRIAYLDSVKLLSNV